MLIWLASARSIVSSLGEALLDIVYPPTCLVCDQGNQWICATCWQAVRPFSTPQPVPVLPSGSEPVVSHIWTILPYAHPFASSLLKTYKYQSAFCLESVFAELMARYRSIIHDGWPFAQGEGWNLISLPTDPGHLKKRGMDHTARLANVWQKQVFPDAKRQTPMTRLPSEQANAELHDKRHREVNVANVFSAKPVSGKWILIDDVYTTGASSQAAAKTLLEAGADTVEILVIAMG